MEQNEQMTTGWQGRFRLWLLRGVAILTTLGLVTFLWLRAVPPLWVSSSISGGTYPIGFTPDGHLVTADGDFEPNSPLKITTWNVKTGEVIHQVSRTIPLKVELMTQWAGGTDCIVTRVIRNTSRADDANSDLKLAVIDRRSGQLLYPELDTPTGSTPVISVDGRYMVVMDESDVTTAENSANVIDLKTGRSCFKTVCRPDTGNLIAPNGGQLNVEQVLFTPDSRELVSLECDETSQRWVVFRSIPDGNEVGRCRLPDFTKYEGVGLGNWSGGRLLFRAFTQLRSGGKSQYVSFDVIGHELSGRREEPGFAQRYHYEIEVGEFSEIRDHWKVCSRRCDDNRGPKWIELCNRWLAELPGRLAIKHQPRPHLWVQFVRQTDDSPLGMPLFLEGHDGSNYLFAISNDGQWVASGGDRLRVWNTPPPSRWWRLPQVILVAALGWVCDRWVRRRIRCLVVTG